ncbi:hypothetical protein FRB90_001348 [Tulasnella sp. 427]|nr:hypothetical protein FRB90_001348 [Tulasnella sp. 427]
MNLFIEEPSKAVNYSGQISRYPQNDVPPIHRIPFEILLQIIEIYIGESPKPIQALLTLAQVCQRWCKVVDEPTLWRKIDACEGPDLVQVVLEKAQKTPLSLIFKENTADLPLEEFFELIRGHIDQWTSLVVESSQLKGLCAPIENSVPPRLRKLHLSVSEYASLLGTTTDMPLFGGHPAPPSLQDVSFTTISPDLSQLCLTGLKSLELNDVDGPTEAEFIRILRSSPALQDLRLICSWFQPSGVEGQSIQVQPAQLPSLINIYLRGIPFDAVRFILSCIDAPELRTLKIGCDMQTGRIPIAELFGENVPHLLRPLRSIVSASEDIKVTFRFDCSLRMFFGGFGMSLGYGAGPYQKTNFDYFQESFGWLESCIDKSVRDIPVHLQLQDIDLTPQVLQWFTSRTKITKLTVLATTVSGYPPAPDVLHLLSRTYETSSPATWPLPHLEIVSLEVLWADLTYVPQCIQDLVEHRSKRHQGAVPAVAPLREIRLSAVHHNREHCFQEDPVPQDNEFLRNVEMAAGGLEIYWEGKRWTSSC